jgi:hypothetical protein
VSELHPADRLFLETCPAYSALALVDTEPNEQVVEVLKGYLTLRKVAAELLQSIRSSADSDVTPNIVVSINELVAQGRNRDQLRRFCRDVGISCWPHPENVWKYVIPPFGKNSHLAVALMGCICPYIMVADVGIDEALAYAVFLEGHLGGVHISNGLFFWENQRDRTAHIMITNKWLLNSESLLNKTNDMFVVQKRSTLWGGFRFKGWTPTEPRKKFKFDRPQKPSNLYERNHSYTLQDLIDSLLYEASRRSDSPRRVDVSYGIYQ